MTLIRQTSSDLALTGDELLKLGALEAVVANGLDTFYEVGKALAEIKEQRLYREKYDTFADYCRERWQIGKSRAYQLIGAANVMSEIAASTTVDTTPQNEAQLRPLMQLAPERRTEAWQKVLAAAPDGKITAEIVQAVVDEMLGKSGRVDPGLFYPVFEDGRIIFNQGFKLWNDLSSDPKFYGCQHIIGKRINNEKTYDGYTLVDVPALNIPPLPNWLASGSNVAYPIDVERKIVFQDPIDYAFQTGGRYDGYKWINVWEFKQSWQSIVIRLWEFDVLPPLPLSRLWVQTANFRPGEVGRCYSCSASYPYGSWVASGIGAAWICPKGHVQRDYNIYKVTESKPVTTSRPDMDTDSKNVRDEPTLPSDVESFLYDVQSIDAILQPLIDNPQWCRDALKPENLAIWNKDNPSSKIDKRLVEAVDFLIEVAPDWSQAEDDTDDESEDDETE